MRRTLVVVILCTLALAGCTAQGTQDPFAYTKKPLYTGGFDLEDMPGPEEQQFRVEDGSIAQVHVQVWVNATAGGALVEVLDSSGRVVLTATQATEQGFPLKLGVWTVRVTPEGEAPAGHVSILVTRR